MEWLKIHDLKPNEQTIAFLRQGQSADPGTPGGLVEHPQPRKLWEKKTVVAVYKTHCVCEEGLTLQKGTQSDSK